ncbi:MAG: cytochrome b/b6 domain-containing protein, partial [Draconibacterium sp.]|nr:cytochrome b/b6 domain-containing protein [Draconibacterium sp.]
MSTKEKIYLYPVWLRIWHAINAIGILILIVSGLNLQFSKGSLSLINFESAINMHNVAGVIVSINYLLFFFGNMFLGNKKYYRIKPKGCTKRIVKQAKYYAFGMFTGQKTPFPISEKRKFNPLQKYSYLLIMYIFVPVIII